MPNSLRSTSGANSSSLRRTRHHLEGRAYRNHKVCARKHEDDDILTHLYKNNVTDSGQVELRRVNLLRDSTVAIVKSKLDVSLVWAEAGGIDHVEEIAKPNIAHTLPLVFTPVYRLCLEDFLSGLLEDQECSLKGKRSLSAQFGHQ
jgi:hypothetical protein